MNTKKLLLTALTSLGIAFSLQAQTKKVTAKTVVKSVAATDLKASVQRGQVVYAANCLSCHQADGGGIPSMNAPLIKTSYVLGDSKKLIGILLKGMQGVEIDGEDYRNIMPQFTHLTNQQIADVLTYVRNSFGNKAPAVTVKEVNALKK